LVRGLEKEQELHHNPAGMWQHDESGRLTCGGKTVYIDGP
jgi:hypothetical protein